MNMADLMATIQEEKNWLEHCREHNYVINHSEFKAALNHIGFVAQKVRLEVDPIGLAFDTLNVAKKVVEEEQYPFAVGQRLTLRCVTHFDNKNKEHPRLFVDIKQGNLDFKCIGFIPIQSLDKLKVKKK